jgi:alpha-1,2-mannosyltransferase
LSAVSRTAQSLPVAAGRAVSLARRRQLTLTQASILVTTALALGLRVYQLARPNYLFGPTTYDDGADFGTALRLIDGSLPYRDYVFLHPPGIALLLSPVALLAKAIGTDGAFAVARILTACASAAGVLLVGLLVRHRGVLATTLACGLLAVNPDGILDASSVFLEPWLMVACLLGALIMFQGDELTSSRKRLALGGVAFGIGGAIKVWAILPVILLVWFCWRAGGRRSVTAYLGGVAAGFAIPVLPFVAMAPSRFWGSVIVAQLSRTDVARVPLLMRLVSLSGVQDLGAWGARPPTGAQVASWIVISASVAIVALIVVRVAYAALARSRSLPTLDRFVIGALAVALVAFLWPADYYPHYAGFFAPFLALAIALAVTGLVGGLAPASVRRVTIVAAMAIAAMAGVRLYHEAGLAAPSLTAWIDRLVPPGSCVVTDNASMTIAADRFIATNPNCSKMVDAYGTSLALAGGRNGLLVSGADVSLQSVWLSGLRQAGFVWLQCGPPAAASCDERGRTNRLIPWTPEILGYFHRHFRLLATGTGLLEVPAYLYVRVSS